MNRALWESTEMLQILITPHEIIDYSDKKLKVKSWKIEFENINFSYEDWKQVFKDLNLSIKPWEKIAIVWTSWSWKTTLIKLLFRFFDINWWKILIDWEDIKYVTQDSLREQLSMVPQDPVLFHRTIKENIAYWRPNATDEEIIAASVWIWALLYKWYKSLFWEEKTWDKENNESNKTNNSDETEENQSDKGNKNNDKEDEDLETNETTDEDIKRFHKIADALYEKDKHEHQYYNNSEHICAKCWDNKERIERIIHCSWTINKGGKRYSTSFTLNYKKDSNKFYYGERDSEDREIKWSELRKVLKDIEDQLKWNYRRLKRLAY